MKANDCDVLVGEYSFDSFDCKLAAFLLYDNDNIQCFLFLILMFLINLICSNKSVQVASEVQARGQS